MDHRTATAVADLCAALESGAPFGWSSITLDVWANVLAYEVASTSKNAEGRFAGEVRQPPRLIERMQELRERMYDEAPDRGAWLSARFTLRRGAEPEASFNYDDDPKWSPELHPMMFVRDLEAFPRAEEHVSPWLREVVARGLELEREHEAEQADR